MEISTEIKKNIRWHTVRGVIDIEKLTEYLKEIYSLSNFDSEMKVFWDLQEADFTSVSTEDLQHFKEYIGKQWGKEGKSKAALVVPHDLAYGLSRMYEIMMESESSSEITVFRCKDKAKEWIKSK
jgi:hypothetical protein